MSSNVITEIISLIAFVLLFIFAAITFARPITQFVYYFVKDSGEVVCETISDLVTISAGTPGEAKIIYTKPSSDFTYQIDIYKKIIYIKSDLEKQVGSTREKIIESLGTIEQESYSTTGVEIKNEESTVRLFSIIINKKNGEDIWVNLNK